MPETRVVYYKDENGKSPVIEWLDELKRENAGAYEKCEAVIRDLEELGHELRRPMADMLRDGIMELRTNHLKVRYRLLYFFNGKDFAVLAHAIEKKVSGRSEGRHRKSRSPKAEI